MTHFSKTKFAIFPGAILTGAILMLGAPQAASAQSSAPLTGLFACEVVANKDAQLACFRAETAKLRAADVSASAAPIERKSLSSAPVLRAPEVSPPAVIAPPNVPSEVKQAEITKPAVSANEDEDFGFAKKKADKENRADNTRVMTVASSERWGPNRLYRFTMENGEVWQQTEVKGLRVGKVSPDVISIKKARLGSYVARLNEKKPAFRVKRLK